MTSLLTSAHLFPGPPLLVVVSFAAGRGFDVVEGGPAYVHVCVYNCEKKAFG